MIPTGNYPMMSQSEWDSAPWNQVDNPDKEFDCVVYETVMKKSVVSTCLYEEGELPTNEAMEEEWQMQNNSIPVLLERMAKLLEKWRPAQLSQREARYADGLLKEAQGWEQMEFEVSEKDIYYGNY